MSKARVSIVFALAGLLTAGVAVAEVRIVPEIPDRGQLTMITVSDQGRPVSGARVTATYRPRTEVAEVESVGVTDDAGNVRWTPRVAGLARLQAERTDPSLASPSVIVQDVSVRFPAVPALGVVVLILAGVILFGGVALGLHGLVRSPRHEPVGR